MAVSDRVSALTVPTHRHRDELSSSVPCLSSGYLVTIPAMAKRVLLCPPAYFDVVDQKNPYMSEKVRWITKRPSGNGRPCVPPSNKPDARSKPSLPRPDSKTWSSLPTRFLWVFTKESASSSSPAAWCTLHGSARCPFYVDWYRQRGFKIIEVDLGADYLEGHGDLLWHPDWSRIYAGYGFRSTQGGVEKFQCMSMIQIGNPGRPTASGRPLLLSPRYLLLPAEP